MNNVHSNKRLNVIFSGRVQGVGFRYTTNAIARDFPVTGFVRNKRDGNVEIVVEGSKEDSMNFVNAIRSSQVGRYIDRQEINWSNATGEFKTFRILV